MEREPTAMASSSSSSSPSTSTIEEGVVLAGSNVEEEKEGSGSGTAEKPAEEPEVGESRDSPQRVFDMPTGGTADSDSTGGSETAAPVTGPSHVSQWRAIVSGILYRRRSKSRVRDKAMRRVSTFPPAAAESPQVRPKLGEELRKEFHLEEALMLEKWKPSWRSFSHQELAAATDNFSAEKLIGRGGHAEVYKGCMPDGQLVAVKRLMKKDLEERVGDFLSELGVIAHVNHPNAACLLGFGVDGGLHLILKFSPQGSLASALHGSEEKLGWEKRFKIALGVAEGLLYLHQGCHRRIIHRDIKASNILLTEDYEPQISDFGLAKWLPERWNHHVVFPIEGTFGYLAPEYFMHGIVSEKTDVFAFGVLLLELITGRRAVDANRQSLVIWAKPLLDVKDMDGLVDPSLLGRYESAEMDRVVFTASLCIHHLPEVRPYMNQVVQLLGGGDDVMLMVGKEALKQPGGVSSRRPFLLVTSDSEEENYTPSKYLNDLNRYKQLAMEQ